MTTSERSSEPRGFRAVTLAATERPQQLIYLALHNDYSETFSPSTNLPEDECGRVAVKRLLDGNRSHYGPLEHPSLSLMLRADHNTMMQLRTHRIATFDYQSMRYTGRRMEDLADGELAIEDVFYVRPPGRYHDRQGDAYTWSEAQATDAAVDCLHSAVRYTLMRRAGASEEHARSVLATSYYQNGVVSANLRSWLHLLDIRLKADAQSEMRQLMDLVAAEVQRWVPEIYAWWQAHRRGKALLAP